MFRECLQVAAPGGVVKFARRERGDEVDLGKRGADRHVVAARGDAEADRRQSGEEQARHSEDGMADDGFAIEKRRERRCSRECRSDRESRTRKIIGRVRTRHSEAPSKPDDTEVCAASLRISVMRIPDSGFVQLFTDC